MARRWSASRDTAALVALVRSVARLEIEEGFATAQLIDAPEVLAENRFLAARDGVRAELIDPARGGRVSVATLVDELLEACEPHAHALGCARELAGIRRLLTSSGADRQLDAARGAGRLPG